MRLHAISAESLRLWPSKTATRLRSTPGATLLAHLAAGSGSSRRTMMCRSYTPAPGSSVRCRPHACDALKRAIGGSCMQHRPDKAGVHVAASILTACGHLPACMRCPFTAQPSIRCCQLISTAHRFCHWTITAHWGRDNLLVLAAALIACSAKLHAEVALRREALVARRALPCAARSAPAAVRPVPWEGDGTHQQQCVHTGRGAAAHSSSSSPLLAAPDWLRGCAVHATPDLQGSTARRTCLSLFMPASLLCPAMLGRPQARAWVHLRSRTAMPQEQGLLHHDRSPRRSSNTWVHALLHNGRC